MTPRMGPRAYGRWALLALVAVGLYGLYRSCTSPLTIGEAISGGTVASENSFGGAGSPSTITITRSSWMSRGRTIVIPAGTMLYTGDPSAQRLLIASGLTIVLPDTTESVTAQVKTFCLDEFAVIPPAGTSLSFTPHSGDSTATTEETEPLHKLADCMTSRSEPDAIKQLVVWAIKDDLPHKSQSEALQFLTNGFEQSITQERREKFVTEKRPVLVRAHPLLSEATIDGLIDAEMTRESTQIHNKAAKMAGEQLKNLLQNGRDLLASCGYNVADMPIFR